MNKITILGVFACDTTYFAERLPEPGETLLGTGFKLGPGGKGSNQAVACAKLGSETTLLAMLGNDTFSQLADETWARWGVKAIAPRVEQTHTGAAFIFVEPSGENAIIIAPGAGRLITPQYVEQHKGVIQSADVFMTQLEQPLDAALAGLKLARENAVTTILNPAPAARLPRDMLTYCDYVTPNRGEAELLTGIGIGSPEDARRAGEHLLDKGAQNVIVTMGAEGAYCHNRNASFLVPAYRVDEVVETTGAGDAFNAGLAVGIARGSDLQDAVRLGCATAAISVTRHGTANAMPTRLEVEAFMRD
jgi:ribokinase